jgi:hypothetical protein
LWSVNKIDMKVYKDNIEYEIPLVEEDNLIDGIDMLKEEFKKLITNAKIIKYFGIDLYDG